ncbi:MAG TPA: twin-arginine translocation signal domain-containing protein [Gemmataceae bacterium]|nr:twin-arginine translocation signal domain-containing protein [Gemmataceae bacterium]
MTSTGHNRRRFLQTSLAAGAVLGLSGASLPSGQRPTEEPTRNPRVRPGRVQWHRSFEAACAASRSSGKPAFLFHMMGRLDQRFC